MTSPTLTPISANDLTFLKADRPHNHLTVTGALRLAENPDWDKVVEVLQTRMIERFAVLRSRSRLVHGTWMWEEDLEFRLDRHVRRVHLDDDFAGFASALHASDLPADSSPWEVLLVSGARGVVPGEPESNLVVARFHHVLADGIRIVQLLFGLCDADVEAGALRTGRAGAVRPRRGALGSLTATARHAGGLVEGTVSALATWATGGIVEAAGSALRLGRDAAADPASVVDRFSRVAPPENRLANNGAAIAKLALPPTLDSSPLRGEPGTTKTLRWVEGLRVAEVSSRAKASGATVNDVLVSAVAGALGRYLRSRGDEVTTELNFFVPVSLQPLDPALPAELGNHFAVVTLALPVGERDEPARLALVRERMRRIKNSDEPAIVATLQRLVSRAPDRVADALTTSVADKSLGSVTNVPGPATPITLAGTEVAGVLGWTPTTSRQPLGVCIFSYNGEITIGLSSDDTLVPDPDALIACLRTQLRDAGLTTTSRNGDV